MFISSIYIKIIRIRNNIKVKFEYLLGFGDIIFWLLYVWKIASLTNSIGSVAIGNCSKWK